MLDALAERGDPRSLIALGKIALQLPDERRQAVRERLEGKGGDKKDKDKDEDKANTTDQKDKDKDKDKKPKTDKKASEHDGDDNAPSPHADDDATTLLARTAALASIGQPVGEPEPLRARLHAALTSPAESHVQTLRQIRIGLAAAALAPAMSALVDPADVTWLTRFDEPDIRASAHALLERLGHPMPPAQPFDAAGAHGLDDDDLAHQLGEQHVLGRAALIAEAGHRNLRAAAAGNHPRGRCSVGALERRRAGIGPTSGRGGRRGAAPPSR